MLHTSRCRKTEACMGMMKETSLEVLLLMLLVMLLLLLAMMMLVLSN